MSESEISEVVEKLVNGFRAISVEHLGRDHKTKQRYAVGFDTDGRPYRAFNYTPAGHRDIDEPDYEAAL